MVTSKMKCLAASLALIVGSSSLLGCISVNADENDDSFWWGFDAGSSKETRTILLDHVSGKAVSVKSANGSVTIKKSADSNVTITARVRAQSDARLKSTEILTTRGDNGTLDIRVKWPDERRKNNEGVSFEIALPDANGITVETSNGSIALSDMSGAAKLESSNGSVTVLGHDGSVHADTSNGAITLTGITGKVNADTSNGSINAALSNENAGPVRLDTSNASVTLAVGAGFGGTLSADTSNGRVTVEETALQTQSVKLNKASARVDFKKTGEKSVIDTSNGSVSIKACSASAPTP